MSTRPRRTIEWLIILAAAALAIAADVLYDGPGVGGPLAYVVAALPGLLTFLVWRSLLAAAVVALAPMYFVIALFVRGWPTHRPELALDQAIPLVPAWMLVYGSLYVFVIVLPLLVVRDRALVRRAMQSYLLVMLLSYAVFLLYPTAAPHDGAVPGRGFAAWTLGVLYSIDAPYNCFPSLHVAYAFVAAFACRRVHRGLGNASLTWAALIGISTLFTKQHYVMDVIAGAAAGCLAFALFLRGDAGGRVPERDRSLAPQRAFTAVALYGLMIVGFWVAYHFNP